MFLLRETLIGEDRWKVARMGLSLSLVPFMYQLPLMLIFDNELYHSPQVKMAAFFVA